MILIHQEVILAYYAVGDLCFYVEPKMHPTDIEITLGSL